MTPMEYRNAFIDGFLAASHLFSSAGSITEYEALLQKYFKARQDQPLDKD